MTADCPATDVSAPVMAGKSLPVSSVACVTCGASAGGSGRRAGLRTRGARRGESARSALMVGRRMKSRLWRCCAPDARDFDDAALELSRLRCQADLTRHRTREGEKICMEPVFVRRRKAVRRPFIYH